MTEPGEPTSVGAIIGYLRLDRSDWDAQISAAQRKADELGRSNPNIRIQTNSRDAITQLAAVAAAARALQDAQGQAGLAQQRLNELRASGTGTAAQLRAAEEKVASTSRAVEDAQIRLAAAYQRSEQEASKAAAAQFSFASSNEKAGKSADDARKPIMSLVGALALVAPAAIPIASVAGGAMAGLIPVTAALALGVKGVAAEMKSGALDGTRYGRDINQVKGELQNLQAIAAGGLLSGLDRGLTTSRPLFRELNSDTQMMSTQLGDIAAHAGPALLRLLTELNPLFVTFGQLITRGATELEHYAQNTTGVESFVRYVQRELPEVMQFLGELAVLFSHVTQAAAPFGGVVLTGLTLVVRALDALPVDVLRVLVPLLVAARVAMLGYRGVSTIVDGVSRSWTKLTTTVGNYAAKQDVVGTQLRAAALRNQAAVAEEARVTALARAQEAEAAVTAAREQVTAAANVSEAAQNEARVVLQAKLDEAAAARTAAAAAITAARETGAAAETAATRAKAAGAETEGGLAAASGGIGGLLLGVGLLATAFLGQSHDAELAAQSNDTYTESVKKSTDALSAANVAATNQNLANRGLLDALDQLKGAGVGVTLTYADMAKAVNGSQQDFDRFIGALNSKALSVGAVQVRELVAGVTQLRDQLHHNIDEQDKSNAAQRQAEQLYHQGGIAAQGLADRLGLTGNAYLTARAAAVKNTQQTEQQTAAFQLENDAASLLQAALDRLAGKGLNMAEAQTALNAANLQVEQSFKKNKTAIDGNGQAAINNQQALQQQAQAAIQAAEAVGKATGSNDAEAASLAKSKQQLEDQLAAHNRLTPAVQAYINKLYSLKQIRDYLNAHPTKVDIDTREAQSQIRALNSALDELKNKELSVGGYVNVKHALSLPGNASGGGVPDGLSWVGEGGPGARPELLSKHGSDVQVISHPNSVALAKAAGIEIPGFASGTGNAERIWRFLMQHGLRPVVAAGFMGNFDVETGGTFSPDAYNPREQAIGIAQWEGGRRTALQAFAARRGSTERNLQTQLEFFWYELHHGYGDALRSALAAHSARQAAAAVDRQYEISSGDTRGERMSDAAQILAQARGGLGGYGNTAPSGNSGLTSATDVVQRKIHKGGPHGVTGIADMIRSEIPDSAQAMRDLAKAVDAAFDLKGVKAQLGDARDLLHNMRQYQSGVEQTYSGDFDPTQYGTIGGLVHGLMGAAGANTGIAHEIRRLRHEHLNNAYLRKLITEGDTSTLQLLAGGSQAQIDQVNRALGHYDRSLNRIGGQAVLQRFGHSVDRQEHIVTHLVGEQRRLMKKIERLTDEVTKLDKRPTVIELDGEVIYRSTNRKLAKKLGHHTGRRG